MQQIGCQHIKKLTKKQISDILIQPPQFMCLYHSKIINPVICLHCNQMFCDNQHQPQNIYQKKQSCIQKHRKQTKNDLHIFHINLQQQHFNIFCACCSINLQGSEEKLNKESDQYRKLIRFLDCLKDMLKNLKKIYGQQKQNALVYRGLHNLGNTCFLNVALQSLNYSIKLKQTYLSYNFDQNKAGFNSQAIKRFSSPVKYIGKQVQFFYDQLLEKVQQNTWHVVKSKKNSHMQNRQKQKRLIKKVENSKINFIFKNFFTQLSKTDEQSYSPVNIIQQITKLDQKYHYNEEQDAQQTLLFLIDILAQGEQIGLGYQMQRYDRICQIIGKQKITPIQRIFGTYLVSQIYCKQCKKVSLTFDMTYHLSISVDDIILYNEKNKQDIQHNEDVAQFKQKIEYLTRQEQYFGQLRYPKNRSNNTNILSFFFKEEILTKKQNYYECSNCPSLVGSKRFYLVSLPQILIISIKRFDHKMKKNTKLVQFQQKLNVQAFCLEAQLENKPQNCLYQLYGVIVHLGTTISNGHYVCYLKNKGQWLRFSDSLVRKVTWSQVNNAQAYILLYQRGGPQQ